MNAHQLRQLSDEAGDAAAHLIAAAARFGIDAPLRQAHWLAQLGHESRGSLAKVAHGLADRELWLAKCKRAVVPRDSAPRGA